MCYQVATPSKNKLKTKFKDKNISFIEEEKPHISGFTRPYLPVTLNGEADSIIAARWKLIPYWIKNENEANKYANTLNAEGESVFEKASYKHYIGSSRGLLYVNGFYEPHKVEDVKKSETYYIYTPTKEIFTLGIVYSMFSNQETGEIYPTFSVLTTPANPLLAEIHNEKKRMPLIISPQDRENWLFAKEKNDIQKLIKPFSGELDANKVLPEISENTKATKQPNIQLALF